MDKCWCGKELGIGAAIPGKVAPIPVCPTHGENWRERPAVEWRKCPEYGGDPELAQWTPNINAAMISREVRCCKADVRDEEDGLPFGVTPETCASCPIPDAMRAKKLWDACGKLLVEAVNGLLRAIDYQVNAGQETNSERAAAYQDLVRIEKDKANAALALVISTWDAAKETPCPRS